MQIGDAVESFMIFLQWHPLPQRTEEVAEMERIRGGLGKGEYAWSAGTAV